MAIADPLFGICGHQVERRLQAGAGAVDGCRRQCCGQTVAPFAQFAGGKHDNALVEQLGRKVGTDPTNIAGVTATSLQIGLVAVESITNRNGLLRAIAAAQTSALTGLVLGLPIVEDRDTIRILEIVSRTDGLGPITAAAIGHPHNPCAGGPIASITKAEAVTDPDEGRLLGDRLFQAGSACFEI